MGQGTEENDNVTGDAFGNIIFGDKGDDSLYGNDGNDVISGGEGNDLMLLFADKIQPEIKSREELAEIWDGTAVIISKKGIADREAIFSFKWFIPTILKFKKEFIQVLIAVFTVQILGILTPVMTQVVVDKVLVHRSMSTLNVLAIGIGMLTVIVICSIPVYAVLSAIVTPLFRKRLDEKFETGANTQSFLVESITGVQTVKSYALEPKFEKK